MVARPFIPHGRQSAEEWSFFLAPSDDLADVADEVRVGLGLLQKPPAARTLIHVGSNTQKGWIVASRCELLDPFLSWTTHGRTPLLFILTPNERFLSAKRGKNALREGSSVMSRSQESGYR